MPKQQLLEKLADLAVKVGVNVQPDQPVVIRASTQVTDLVRLITEAAYAAGAKRVHVNWGDDYVSRSGLNHMKVETLEEVPNWQIEQAKHIIDEGGCLISIASPIPGLNAGVDPMKMQRAGIAMQKAMAFFQTYVMGNKTQWTIVAASNPEWAVQVFPTLPEAEAVEALWHAIFEASRVTLDTDPVKNWAEHNTILLKRNKTLNDLNFKSLHFQNSLGTDLVVELVKDHVWAGGGEHTTQGVYFNPNIPTEETFTMPYKWGTQGKVVATKPLNYQGKLIEDFYLVFKDGQVIDYDAKKQKDALTNILNTDDGSKYIGEIALISHDSPISNTGILFLNTLFDENASCHMALGRAYPMNIKDGVNTPVETLKEAGYNHSMVHVDFMFGSADMEVTGTTHDGRKIKIIEKGDFII